MGGFRMKSHKIISLIAILMSLIMLLSACGSSNAQKNADPVSPDEGNAVTKDTLVVQYGPEPDTLDTHQTALMTTFLVIPSIHGQLVRLEKGEIVGDLAESWTWNSDYSELIFKMRDNICFSDGSPITANDVAYTFNRNLKEGYGYSFLRYIDSVTATSNTEVVIKLNQPCFPFLSALTTANFVVYSQAAMEAGMDVAKLPNVTSGPYYVDSWIAGEKIILKANEHYYGGVPEIKTVDLLFMTDENTALIAFESGDIDVMCGGGTSINASSVERIKSIGKSSLIEYTTTGYYFMVLNQSVKYFADKNVRRAIDLAINRDDIVAVAVDGNGTPAGLPIREGIGGYVKGVEPTKQDLEAAKKLMADSAYPDGFSFTALVPSSGAYKKAAQVIQSQLVEIGINMQISEADTGSISTNMANNNFEASVWSWTNASGDISNISDLYIAGGPKCYAKFKNTDIGDLLAKSAMVEGEARAKILAEVYDIIEEEVPYIGMFWPIGTFALQEGLTMSGEVGILGSLPFHTMKW
jgi:peptide/nickel transport system substrate-binding protein